MSLSTLLIFVGLTLPSNQPESGSGISPQKSDQLINYSNQNSLEKKLMLSLALGALLTFGFQMATAQGEMTSWGEKFVKEVETLKKMVDSGTTDFSWKATDMNDPERHLELSLKSKEERKSVYTYLNDLDWKKLNPVMDALAKSINKRGGLDATLGIKKETGMDPTLKIILGQITETTAAVDAFDGKTVAWTARYEWIMRAISEETRRIWAEKFFKGFESDKGTFYAELDKLSASFAKAAPKLKISDELFANHNAPDEALMKKELPNAAKVKIHKIGIADANWKIQKDKLNIPEKRFKFAYVYGKNADDDFSYCRLYQINIKQDHIGGGKYGDTYVTFIDSWPRMCPK